jgi:DNA-binding response OmpR family regulator
MTKALLVTHDQNFSSTTCKSLGFYGLNAYSVPNEKLAWEVLQKKKIDFVIIDLYLKEGSGLALYKSLRYMGEKIPVMMAGTDAMDELILKDLSLYNYDYILKSMKCDQVKEKLRHFLAPMLLNQIHSCGQELNPLERDIFLLLLRRSGEFVHPKQLKKMLEVARDLPGMSLTYFMVSFKEKLKSLGYLNIKFMKHQGYMLQFVA